MITSSAAVDAALDVAAAGLRRGEMPIGAVVFRGDELIARAHTEERTQGRRIKRPGEIEGGIHRERSQALFAEYAAGDGPRGMRVWASGLSEL